VARRAAYLADSVVRGMLMVKRRIGGAGLAAAVGLAGLGAGLVPGRAGPQAAAQEPAGDTRDVVASLAEATQQAAAAEADEVRRLRAEIRRLKAELDQRQAQLED